MFCMRHIEKELSTSSLYNEMESWQYAVVYVGSNYVRIVCVVWPKGVDSGSLSLFMIAYSNASSSVISDNFSLVGCGAVLK